MHMTTAQAVPDSRGANLFAADARFADLLSLYREPKLHAHLLPKSLPDQTPNSYRIIRLKDKLGARDMASGEIRLEGASAWLVGDPGRGFLQMTDMINNSRLSSGVRAAGMMRRSLTEALHVARNRKAFRRLVIDMPLMRRQLLKLMLLTEQARSVALFAATALQTAGAASCDGFVPRYRCDLHEL